MTEFETRFNSRYDNTKNPKEAHVVSIYFESLEELETHRTRIRHLIDDKLVVTAAKGSEDENNLLLLCFLMIEHQFPEKENESIEDTQQRLEFIEQVKLKVCKILESELPEISKSTLNYKSKRANRISKIPQVAIPKHPVPQGVSEIPPRQGVQQMRFNMPQKSLPLERTTDSSIPPTTG